MAFETLTEIPSEFWGVLAEMAPYLLFGFLVAGVLSVAVSPERVERHLGGRGIWPVVKAAAFGVPLPLCSCGVIPVSASLRRHGASRGATVAFLIATPQDGVDSVAVTFSLLGGAFAIFRLAVALVTGIVGGAVVAFSGADEQASGDETCREACCAPGGAPGGRLRRIFSYGFLTLPRDIGRALVVGLLVAALIGAVVPKDFFAGVLGGGVLAMLVMMALGVPVYVCATASVPIAAALVAKGASPGAALVFLMTGPASNAATIATVWKVMGRRTAVIYLATVALGALAAGLAMDYVFEVRGIAVGAAAPWMLPAWLKSAAAVALLGVLGVALVRGKHTHHEADGAGETGVPTRVLRVTGMTCSHCADTVRRALEECPGVESAEVDLVRGRAVVKGGADADALVAAVGGVGYHAEAEAEDGHRTSRSD